jgi:hypothetical protein
LYFHHNIIKNCTYGFELWSRGGCNLDSMFIENNTMINSGGWGNVQAQRPQSPNRFPDPWCGLGRGDLLDFHSISATWTHIYVRNNIFYQNQADRCIYLPDDASSAISGMKFDHNLYYHPSGTMIAWPTNQTYTQAQFSAFQSATGNDANSKTGNPLFVSATDFHLQANSPGIGAGAHVGYNQDFDGNAIADVPGVGACEYGTDNAKTGIDQSNGSLPTEFKLNQNFPNPFNPTTIIRFGLPFAAQVSLRVFNTIGQEVATLVDEQKSAGSYDVTFNAKGLASNVYFYRLEAQSIEGGQARNLIATKKLVLLR